jgi:hypothetical protein
MAEEEEVAYRCEYTDVAEDAEPEVHNWLPRPGKAQVIAVGALP